MVKGFRIGLEKRKGNRGSDFLHLPKLCATMQRWEYLLLLVLVLFPVSYARKCDCEGFYCVSETEYEYCVNGEVVGDRFRCLPGSVCRSKEIQCSPHSVCQEINDCFTEGIFPDLTSIYKFYTCVLDVDSYNWNKREYTCPEGSYFVARLGGCLKEEKSSEKFATGHNSPIFVKEWKSPKIGSNDSEPRNGNEKKYEDIPRFTSGIVFTDISQSALDLLTLEEKGGRPKSIIEQNQASRIEFICLDDGFFPDPKNCQQYFVCDGSSIGKQKKCVNGTYFDADNSACTDRMPERCKVPKKSTDNKEKGEEFSCPGEGYYPDPRDCQRFYMCDEWGSFFHISCPESTYFETKFQDCVYDKPESCRSASVDASEAPSSKPIAHKSDELTEKTTYDEEYADFSDENPRTTKQIEKVNGAIEITTDSGDSENSSEDIRSKAKWNGNVEEDTSMTTARYNEMSEFTSDGKILIAATTEEDEEPPWSYTIGNIFSTSKVTATDGVEGEFVCPGDGYYADLKNCKRYYICFSETPPISISCPDGLYYDENLICSREKPDRCHDSEISTDNHISTTVGYNYGEKNFEFKCSGEGYYPDPNSCHSYYLCNEWNNAIQIECPNNTYYDADIEFCTELVPKRCANTETSSNDNIYQSSVEFDAEEGSDFVCFGEGLLPDPTNCRRYYVCYRHDVNSPLQHGKPIFCPENTYFDDNPIQCTSKMPERCNVLNATDGRVIASTTTASTTKGDKERYHCPGEGYFPDYQNCTRFFVCYDWAPGLSASCPHNTYFDEIKGFCTQEKPERCRATERPPYIYKTSAPIKSDIDQVGSTTVSSVKEFRCPREGYFPDPENCHRYYACYGFGSATLITCPDDTYFDNESVFCIVDVPERCRPSTMAPSSSMPEPSEDEYDSEFACPGAGTFADPKNCRKYWICYNSDFGFPNTCPENTYFHGDINNCLSEIPLSCKKDGDESRETISKPILDQDGNIMNGNEDSDEDDDDGHGARRINKNNPHDYTTPDKDGFKCPEAGYFADPTDCQRYYICYTRQSKFSVECPQNRYFHNRKIGCTSDIPERCQKKNPDDDKFVCPGVGYFPDPNDCRRYYVCDFRNVAYPVTCPRNKYFHGGIRGCSEEIPYICFRQPWYQNKSGSDEFTCSGVGYFPDPKNCSLYHVCSAETRALRENCPSNMYYDEDVSSCTSSLPARCRNSERDKFTTQATTIQTTLDYMTSTTSKSEVYVCPRHGILPDPNDCQKFYICYGRPRQVKCSEGTYFNAETKRCDSQKPERCREGHPGRQSPPSTISEKASKTKEPKNFVCPKAGIFPDAEDCQSFYICFGQPRRRKCQSGLYFNAETKRCVKEMQPRCLNSAKVTTVQPASLSKTDEQEFQCPRRGVFADPNDCRYFYVCYGFTKRVACRSGTFFSEETKFCDFTMPPNCFNNASTTPTPYSYSTELIEIEFNCRSPGRFADPKNCRRYYVCTWQLEPTLFTCPYSTYFNEYAKECKRDIPDRCWNNDTQVTTVAPSGFACRKRGYFPDPKNCQSFYHCEDDGAEPVLYNCPKNKFFNKEKGKCKKSKNGFNYCQYERSKSASRSESTSMEIEGGDGIHRHFTCTYPGLYPDPHNCKKYYECTSNLEAIHKTCFGETNFSGILRSCTYFTSQNCRKFNF